MTSIVFYWRKNYENRFSRYRDYPFYNVTNSQPVPLYNIRYIKHARACRATIMPTIGVLIITFHYRRVFIFWNILTGKCIVCVPAPITLLCWVIVEMRWVLDLAEINEHNLILLSTHKWVITYGVANVRINYTYNSSNFKLRTNKSVLGRIDVGDPRCWKGRHCIKQSWQNFRELDRRDRFLAIFHI